MDRFQRTASLLELATANLLFNRGMVLGITTSLVISIIFYSSTITTHLSADERCNSLFLQYFCCFIFIMSGAIADSFVDIIETLSQCRDEYEISDEIHENYLSITEKSTNTEDGYVCSIRCCSMKCHTRRCPLFFCYLIPCVFWIILIRFFSNILLSITVPIYLTVSDSMTLYSCLCDYDDWRCSMVIIIPTLITIIFIFIRNTTTTTTHREINE